MTNHHRAEEEPTEPDEERDDEEPQEPEEEEPEDHPHGRRRPLTALQQANRSIEKWFRGNTWQVATLILSVLVIPFAKFEWDQRTERTQWHEQNIAYQALMNARIDHLTQYVHGIDKKVDAAITSNKELGQTVEQSQIEIARQKVAADSLSKTADRLENAVDEFRRNRRPDER